MAYNSFTNGKRADRYTFARFLSFLIVLLCLVACKTKTLNQSKTAKPEQANKADITLVSYNVENLFDTEDDPTRDDNDFLPAGTYAWTDQRYRHKLRQLDTVLHLAGNGQRPQLIGLLEVENATVVSDLFSQQFLASGRYKFVLADSSDGRGINVGFAWQPTVFAFEHSVSYTVVLPKADKPAPNAERRNPTRQLLVVSGQLVNTGARLACVVMHWPSRRNPELHRLAAAQTTRQIVDSLQKLNPDVGIVLMGDLNDEPLNRSLRTQGLNSVGGDSCLAQPGTLCNPMVALQQKGESSYFFYSEKKKNLLDQFILSPSLYSGTAGVQFLEAGIFKKPFLLEPGTEADPLATFAGKKYQGGYSDHFPIWLRLRSLTSKN
jgi:predicted extracellular nuclease